MNKKKLLWLLVSIVIAVLIIWTIASQCSSFSLKELYIDILTANKCWFMLGIISMLGFIYFEGKAICVIIKELLHGRPRKHGVLYAASDIFFSSITPSATGGQPASAYFIMRDGVSASVAMITLLINLVMYTFSLMITGAVSLILHFDLYKEYSVLGRILVIIGFLILILCAIAFIMLVFKESLTYYIANKIFNILVKIHLIRNVEKRYLKMTYLLEEYRSCAQMLLKYKKMLVNVFVLNLFQRICQISVSMFMYLAVGGDKSYASSVWAVQSLALVGSNGMPVPGAMGVIDYLLLEGFSHINGIDSVANMELLVRGVSFYICVGLCGIITLWGYFTKPRIIIKDR